MSKFTPGPWRIGKNYGAIVCDVPDPVPFHHGNRHEQDSLDAYGGFIICESVCTKGDANLIAAAPELLEALKEVVALSDRKHDAWDKARVAIAKAEGK